MKNKRIIHGFIVVLSVLMLGILYSCNRKDRDMSVHNLVNNELQEIHVINEVAPTKELTSIDSTFIYVHICGAVKNPEVYMISPSTRLVQLIELAGGLTEDAAGDSINQAKMLEDGQQVYIPTKEEVELGSYPSLQGDNSLASIIGGKININKATKEELMGLPGIGEAKALSIIKYREANGGFKVIEDIMNISGIKNSAFDKISDKIVVK